MIVSSNQVREHRQKCASCAGTSLELALQLYDQEQVQTSPYQLVRCPQCALEFIGDPVTRENIFQHYPTDSGAYASELGDSISLVKRCLFWLDARLLLRHLRAGDAVLDVGAGLGTFAHYLTKKGFKVVATDFVNEQAWARKTVPYLQVDLNQTDLPEVKILNKLGGAPKAIVLRHVLEHVYEPAQLIHNLAQLKPDYFLIMVPNGDSVFRFLFGRHWGFFDPPRHLSNFNRRSLSYILNSAGYGSIQTATYGMDETVISIYRASRGWTSSFRKWFSWTSKAMLVSSALSLFFARSVLVVLAKRSDPSVFSS